MVERAVIDVVIESIGANMPQLRVSEMPVDINGYTPKGNIDEILVKSTGLRSTTPIANSDDPLDRPKFSIYELGIRAIILTPNLASDLYATTEEVARHFELINTLQLDDDFYQLGLITFVDAGETYYDEQRGIQYRELMFTLPLIRFTENL